MPRVVSLWFPTLATDRLRRGPGAGRRAKAAAVPAEGPLVTAVAEHGRRVVAACSAEARAAGVAPGQPLAEARVRVEGLAVADADADADAALLARIADHAARRWTPLVEIDGACGLLLDIGASAHLAGGEAALLARIAGAARGLGLAMRGAAADTAAAARAVARHGGRRLTVVPAGGACGAVAALPPAALRLPSETLDLLARLGFATIGALMDAPRAPLVRRFGPVLGERLDAIAGDRAEPIAPRLPPGTPSARRTLAEPIGSAEAIAIVIRDLSEDLCITLERRGIGLTRAVLACERVDARAVGCAVGLVRATRDRDHLADLLARRIDTIDPGFGIEAMTLAAVSVRRLASEQADARVAPPPPSPPHAKSDVIVAFPSRRREPRPAPDLALLVDRLANRFGDRSLHRIAPAESDAPGRMATRIAPLAPPVRAGWRRDWPRPVRLFRRPDRIERFIADLPDHAPDFFVWRGRRLKVTGADGPERVFGEWWRGGERWRTRDYFQVEVEGGGRYWLFRLGDGSDPDTGTGDWYVHGAFG